MNNKSKFVKAVIVFGGGFLAFLLVKQFMKNNKSFVAEEPKPQQPIPMPTPIQEEKPKKFTEEDFQNAEIVANAYTDALKAGESADRLTELNKELMKEFNMRCYLDKSNTLVVCDSKGTTILKK